MCLSTNVYNPDFSHIYVEKEIQDHPNTRNILSCFPNANVILIEDYRHIFNRKRQSVSLQKQSQSFILAKKKQDFIYPSSPVCQSFDERYFYYSSSIMNCIYDCEYCFLKGMYPSGNLVVFVNLEDFFEEIRSLLHKHPVYLCVSYDADLMAMETILHYGEMWAEFASKEKDLTIEIRTKSANPKAFECIPNGSNIILAFTLSPRDVQENYEHKTPALQNRIHVIQSLLQKGYPVRLCMDPLLRFKGWKESYARFLEELHKEIDLNCIRDISIGSFRISKEYLKQMRKQYPDSSVIQYPYTCINGFYQYGSQVQTELETFVFLQLQQYIDASRIYTWKEDL